MKDENMLNRRGFTLIEMVMVITLLGIIGGIIALPLYQGAKGWFEATTREGITESGRIAIERMMREIRNTARTAANAPCVTTATATSFVFGDDPANCASINFSRAGAVTPYTVQRNGVDLANDVNSLTISYYDSNNAVTAVVANIRRLSIEIESISGGQTMRKYSEVYLSNMKGY
jgi:prepilin-type N-terminal cleavage/methylation domain-containing protein